MICLKYVTPIRIVTIVSIWIDAIYALFHFGTLSLAIKFFMLVHLIAAASILMECKRSVAFHKFYGTTEKKD